MNGLWKQGLRFGLVGLTATIIHLSVAWVANSWFGASAYLANGIGFLTAFACSYLGHFYWTFARQSRHQRSLIRFLVVAGLGYAITNVIVWLVTDVAAQPFEFALLGILFIVPPTTGLISRVWAFRAVD